MENRRVFLSIRALNSALHGSSTVLFVVDMVEMPEIPVMTIAIENDHRNSGFFPLKMVIFYSYVSLPEGIIYATYTTFVIYIIISITIYKALI